MLRASAGFTCCTRSHLPHSGVSDPVSLLAMGVLRRTKTKTFGLEAKLTLCRRIHKLSGQSAAWPCVYRPESVCELNIKPQNKQQRGGGNHARFSSFINEKMAILLKYFAALD